MVEDLLAVRGIIVIYEAVRRWAGTFGRIYASKIRQRAPHFGDKWFWDSVHELAAAVFPAFGAAISGSDAEEVVDEADLALRTWFLEHAVATADHAHDLESLDCGRRCPHGLEAVHPSDHGFQRAMIGLDGCY